MARTAAGPAAALISLSSVEAVAGAGSSCWLTLVGPCPIVLCKARWLHNMTVMDELKCQGEVILNLGRASMEDANAGHGVVPHGSHHCVSKAAQPLCIHACTRSRPGSCARSFSVSCDQAASVISLCSAGAHLCALSGCWVPACKEQIHWQLQVGDNATLKQKAGKEHTRAFCASSEK